MKTEALSLASLPLLSPILLSSSTVRLLLWATWASVLLLLQTLHKGTVHLFLIVSLLGSFKNVHQFNQVTSNWPSAEHYYFLILLFNNCFKRIILKYGKTFVFGALALKFCVLGNWVGLASKLFQVICTSWVLLGFCAGTPVLYWYRWTQIGTTASWSTHGSSTVKRWMVTTLMPDEYC